MAGIPESVTIKLNIDVDEMRRELEWFTFMERDLPRLREKYKRRLRFKWFMRYLMK